MDDADAAFARQRHGQSLLRDGIHGGGNDGDSQAYLAGEVCGDVGLGRQDAAASRHDGHIIEA